MTVVSERIINRYMSDHPLIARAFEFLEGDEEARACIEMANVIAVKRLGYNDHGVIHSRIVSGASMLIFDLLRDHVTFSSVREWGAEEEDARLITFLGSYLHDIGNSVHRSGHHIHGCYIASGILDRLLSRLYDRGKATRVRQEVIHAIYAHDEREECLSIEAGIAKIADGTDMAEGRARIPYSMGKVDIHSLSALSIRRVEIVKGGSRPVRIIVHMDNVSGIFQVEQVLMGKIATSGLSGYIEVVAMERGRELKRVG